MSTASKKSKSPANDTLSTAKAILEETAKKLKCSPSEVPPSDFWSAAGDQVSAWHVRHLGGVTGLKKRLWPNADISKTKVLQHHSRLDKSRETSSLNVDVANKALREMIEELSDSVFKGRVTPQKKSAKQKKSKPIKRVVNALWSDLHIGADIKASETGFLDFGKTQESRRLAALVKQVCSYKIQYRKESSLALHILGDIIQGSLHDPRDGAPQAEQFARALHLLSQAVAHLSEAFPSVEIFCNPGNHGRNTARHHDRAIHQKWDAIETMLYYSLKAACAKLGNVTFHIPMTPFTKPEILGIKMFGTHGDTVLKAGQPNKSLSMGALENQINKINASLPDAEEYKVFMMGHVHIPAIVHLDNGSVVITNGCMVPTDAFSVSLGNLENHCGQWVWETIAGHPVGDSRLIRLGSREDNDPELDKLISPWKSF